MISNSRNSFLVREFRSKRRNTFMTVICLGCVIFIFLIAYAAFGDNSAHDLNLKQVFILFRHGERAPQVIYPTDPHANYPWPGKGDLLNEGKSSMYKFGEKIRKRYNGFISEKYLPEELYVRSSYSARCQMSAMTLLAGLYPPVGDQVWNEDLLWQPIPVNPISPELDNLIASKAPCSAFISEKSKSDAEINSLLTTEQKEVLLYLSKFTKEDINLEKVDFLYSTLKVEELMGLQLPSWTKSVYPEPMKTLAALNLAAFSRTNRLLKLGGGPLLKEWLNKLKNGEGKLHLYSGHDKTIITLMRTLGFHEVDFLPDFGAAFILEYHQDPNEDFVKALYYNSSSSEEPMILSLPHCGEQCSLAQFEENVKPFIPNDWKRECENL